MAWDFSDRLPEKLYSAAKATAVTPHDSTNLSNTTRALWVGVSGDVSVEMVDSGSAIVHKNVQGQLNVRCTRVNSTDTTATDIVAWF